MGGWPGSRGWPPVATARSCAGCPSFETRSHRCRVNPTSVPALLRMRPIEGKRWISPMHSPVPSSASAAPVRPIAYAEVAVIREPLPGGATLLRAHAPLQAYNPSLAHMFRAAHAVAPGRIFLAERTPDGWRKLTYAQARPVV